MMRSLRFDIAALLLIAHSVAYAGFSVGIPSPGPGRVDASDDPIPTIVAYDTFTVESDLETISGRLSDSGHTWSYLAYSSGTVKVAAANDRLYKDAISTTVATLGYVPVDADYSVEGDFYVPVDNSSNFIAICGRVNAAANTMYRATLDPSNNLVTLAKFINGTNSILGTPYAMSVVQGASHTIKLNMVGTTIKVFVDTVERISYDDSSSPITDKGSGGIRGYGAGTTSNVELSAFRVIE